MTTRKEKKKKGSTLPETLTGFALISPSHLFSFKFKSLIQTFFLACLLFILHYHHAASFDDDLAMEKRRDSNRFASNGSQFPASTFPETFKDFFSMINEDEDQVELVSSVLEDKVSGVGIQMWVKEQEN